MLKTFAVDNSIDLQYGILTMTANYTFFMIRRLRRDRVIVPFTGFRLYLHFKHVNLKRDTCEPLQYWGFCYMIISYVASIILAIGH